MIRPKKILLLITKSVWGGAQRYVYDLATNLDKNKFEVAVALGGNGPLKEKLKQNNIRVIELDDLGRDLKVKNDLKILLYLIKLFRVEKPDVVHVNSSKIGGLGAVAGRLSGIPKIIFTAHGWAFNEDRGGLTKIIIKFFHWLTVMFNHQVVAVSNSIKEQVANWPFVNNKMRVIHLGFEENFLDRKEAQALLFGNKIPTNTLIIGTIGELHQIKGQKYLIEALSNINETSFVCIIIGEGEERKNLEKLIREKEMEKKIYLFGHIDGAAKYLKAFDLFILPSLSEALGYALVEAGAAGLPVIASRVGGIPEIVDNLENGLLVTPRRPNEIKQAFIYLLNHQEDMKKFGENLQKKVTKKFNLKRMVEETENLYLNS